MKFLILKLKSRFNRESNSGAQVAQLKSSSELQSQLEASNQEISELRKRLSQSEELGVGSLVEMEDELARLKNENDELRWKKLQVITLDLRMDQ